MVIYHRPNPLPVALHHPSLPSSYTAPPLLFFSFFSFSSAPPTTSHAHPSIPTNQLTSIPTLLFSPSLHYAPLLPFLTTSTCTTSSSLLLILFSSHAHPLSSVALHLSAISHPLLQHHFLPPFRSPSNNHAHLPSSITLNHHPILPICCASCNQSPFLPTMIPCLLSLHLTYVHFFVLVANLSFYFSFPQHFILPLSFHPLFPPPLIFTSFTLRPPLHLFSISK